MVGKFFQPSMRSAKAPPPSRAEPGPPGPSLPKLSKAEARARYTKFSANHPTIHCNRFAPWEELSKAEQRKWRDPAYKG